MKATSSFLCELEATSLDSADLLNYNLDLSMRVSPSGKAVASQATIHGFESRHPLSKKKAPGGLPGAF